MSGQVIASILIAVFVIALGINVWLDDQEKKG